jgi:hypothetical protein
MENGVHSIPSSKDRRFGLVFEELEFAKMRTFLRSAVHLGNTVAMKQDGKGECDE